MKQIVRAGRGIDIKVRASQFPKLDSRFFPDTASLYVAYEMQVDERPRHVGSTASAV